MNAVTLGASEPFVIYPARHVAGRLAQAKPWRARIVWGRTDSALTVPTSLTLEP